MHLSDIETPALIIDRRKLIDNITSMVHKAKKCGVSLRPHVKTHKCLEIGKLQSMHGAEGITVSTIAEAKLFANEGHDDIIYAVPIELSKANSVLELAERCSLKVLVDSQEIVEPLGHLAQERGVELEVLIKVDIGYHRCGIEPQNPDSIKLVRNVVSTKGLHFAGILTHAGNSYDCSSVECIREVAMQEQEIMITFAKAIIDNEVTDELEIVSIGSTPTIALCKDIAEGITEVRPGNYVYYDYTQVALGVCKVADCALTVLARVIGKYNGRIVIDAGATSLSKDGGPEHVEPDCGYGKVYADYEESILDSGCKIYDLSQEHGKISVTLPSRVSSFRIGDQVRILPNHSCLTNNLFTKAYVADGDNIIDTWRIHSGHS